MFYLKAKIIDSNFKPIVFVILMIENSNAISWQDGPDGKWSMGCDFFGKDLINRLSKGEECSGLCKTISGCTHFTWSNYNGGTCWMKSGWASFSEAVQKDNNFVCGIVSNQAPSLNTGNVFRSSFTKFF